MTTGGQQEEENWDDDFEFGSSAGSPVAGRRADSTPPNLSPRAIGRRTLSNGSHGGGLHTPPNSKNRWSSGSLENWDDEDQTINLKALGSGMPQQPVTPKAQTGPLSRTPTRTRKLSEDSEPCWDDEDDVDIAKSAGVMPTHPSAPMVPAASAFNSNRRANGSSHAEMMSPETSLRGPFLPNPPPSAFPSAAWKVEPSGSGTEISTTGTDMMESSDSSIIQQSDTSASTSQSSFFGRLGRRLSKAGSSSVSRNATLSPSVTGEVQTSTFSPAVFSPPAPSSNLDPISPSPSHVIESSPSKSRTGFNFGSGILKRSGSITRSSNSGNLQALPTKENGKKSKSATASGAARTAPAVFNARRYTERIVDPSFSSPPAQYAPPAHGHSHSVAGMPRSFAPGWGAPPSPTKKAKQLGSPEPAEMLTSLSSRSRIQGSTSRVQPPDVSKPSHQPSASMSSAFFSSMRKKSNPLQTASKVPNSAMNGTPPIPRSAPLVLANAAIIDEVPRAKDEVPLQLPQAQILTQRPRRTHRRNVSTGAMITSVIDEVSSDGTINSKLSAAAMRERPAAPPKSGLSQSTTASEIRRASTPPPRMSISSNDSSPPPVSPIEFTRRSNDSGSAGRRSSESAFVLPSSMSIRSPALPTSGIRADGGVNGRRSTDWSPSSSPSDRSAPTALLPPIELCPPSPPAPQTSKPSGSSTREKKEMLTYTPEIDEDKTPMAPPRRRVHHLQIGTGAIVPVASLANGSHSDTPKYEITQDGLVPSISAPGSIASTGSNTTLAPKPAGVNKQLDNLNGRTSPGISASLGRLAGASTAGRIDEEVPKTTNSGLARRNSLSGGVVSASLSTSGSMGGGLKIPARISAKQDALKRDLGAVREFALSIDELKRLQFSYELVIFEVRRLCAPNPQSANPNEASSKPWYKMRRAGPATKFHAPRSSAPEVETPSQPSTPVSPTFEKPVIKRRVHVIRAPEQPKEETVDESSFIPAEQKELATAALAELDLHYSIWWECAGLLIELGGAAPPVVAGNVVRSPTLPALRKPGLGMSEDQSTPRARGRHAALPKQEPESSITDLSNTLSPDPSISSGRRRGSTGQQDLNARQIHLLKGMLSTPNPSDLSSSVDFVSLYATQLQALSPVISNPASTVRTTSAVATEYEESSVGNDQQALTEREKKRSRRVSLAGKLGVREILAGLKWTKEKARQRYKQPAGNTGSAGRKSVDFAGGPTRASIDQTRPGPPTDDASALDGSTAGHSSENLNVVSPAQSGVPPSPYKRNRRRSLASIFKFGNNSSTQSEDRSISLSRSRVDLASPTPFSSGYTSSHRTGSRAEDNAGTDVDSDWDQMNSPSDLPGRYAVSQHADSSAQDLSASPTLLRGRVAPVGVPITNTSRRGSSVVSRNASTSRVAYSSASASAASLVSSSVYGSAASQLSLHESFGGRATGERSDDERRRLKKPPSKQPRRPPSAGGRKSQPISSQDSSSGPFASPVPPPPTSPMTDRQYYSTRSASHKSPSIPEYPNHPYPSASTRSAPMHGTSTSSATDLSQPRLALTPENIIPLLVYAREVKLKLADCLVELKSLESDLLMSKVGGEYLENDGAVEFVPDEGPW